MATSDQRVIDDKRKIWVEEPDHCALKPPNEMPQMNTEGSRKKCLNDKHLPPRSGTRAICRAQLAPATPYFSVFFETLVICAKNYACSAITNILAQNSNFCPYTACARRQR